MGKSEILQGYPPFPLKGDVRYPNITESFIENPEDHSPLVLLFLTESRYVIGNTDQDAEISFAIYHGIRNRALLLASGAIPESSIALSYTLTKKHYGIADNTFFSDRDITAASRVIMAGLKKEQLITLGITVEKYEKIRKELLDNKYKRHMTNVITEQEPIVATAKHEKNTEPLQDTSRTSSDKQSSLDHKNPQTPIPYYNPDFFKEKRSPSTEPLTSLTNTVTSPESINETHRDTQAFELSPAEWECMWLLWQAITKHTERLIEAYPYREDDFRTIALARMRDTIKEILALKDSKNRVLRKVHLIPETNE